MKDILTLFVAAFAANLLLAQEAAPVVVVQAKGKVGLISQPGTAEAPIESGAVAKSSSQILLKKNASALLYCGGQFKEVKGPQTLSLSDLCAQGTNVRTLNADYDFGIAVSRAVEMVAVAKQNGDGWATAVGDPKKGGDGWGTAVGDPKKGGDGWGTAVGDPKKGSDGWGTAVGDPKKGSDGWGTAVGDPKKGSDGWGGKGSQIRAIMPFGKLLAGPTVFSWSKPAASEPYTLTLFDEKSKTVFERSVRDTFLQIDLRTLNLSNDQFYSWKVSVGGSRPMSSEELGFALGTPEEWAEVQKSVKQSPLAISGGSPLTVGLIEAVALENNEWFYAAQQKYAALKTKKPDNMHRAMHAAFWMRHGFSRLAEKAAQQ